MPNRKVELRMTVGYVLGLLLIGVLATVSTYVLYRVIDSQSTASQIYAMISAQQNRIQRIALLTVALTDKSTENNGEFLRKELKNQTDYLMRDHKILSEDLFQKTGFEWEFKHTGSVDIKDIVTYSFLDREIKTFVASARYLGQLDTIPNNTNHISVKVVLDRANSDLMSMLSDLHSKYRFANESKHSLYQKIHIISLGILLLVLVFEGLFLFRPLVNLVRKEHSAILEAKNKADRANRIQSRFLANVSHEIRTPLTAIIGFSDVILSEPDISNSTREKNYTIKRSAIYLKSLIDDLLDYTKASESHIEIVQQDFNLDHLIHEVVSVLSVRTKEKNLNLNVHYATPIPESIHSDPMRMKQVLFNIIGNAIKFTTTGSITIECEYSAEENNLSIRVIDTGIGIDIADQGRIFTRFMQADSSMTRKETGSGIGLSLSKLICKALSGNLRLVESGETGSTFQMNFSLSSASTNFIEKFEHIRNSKELELSKNDLESSLKDVRILLVEDGEENRAIFSYFLELAGARVEVAVNGLEGYEKAVSESYDIILMDIQMPIMDGHEATTKLVNSGCLTPIVALTAHALQAEKDRCFELGFSGYLSKPVEIPQLIATVLSFTKEKVRSKHTKEEAPSPITSIYNDEKIYKPILEQFRKNLPTRMDDIRKIAEKKDWIQLAKLAHKVKGTAASYGFPKLSELAGQLEVTAKSLEGGAGSLKDLNQNVEDLLHTCDRILERPFDSVG